MELDWYHEKLGADAVLTPTSSFKWMSSFRDSGTQSPSRWLSILHLMQDRKALRGYHSGDEHSPPGSNLSSPKSPRDVKCRRSLSGGDTRCPIGSPSWSPLSPSSTKAHVCFGCVLHSHA